MDDDGESKELTKPGNKPLSRAEKRRQDVERFLGELSFMAAAGHMGPVNVTCFSPDGALLASGSDDGTVVIWDAAGGRQLHRMKHGGSVTSVAFSLEGALLASGSLDETVVLWDAAKGRELHRLEHGGWVRSVAFSPDGALLASGSSDGTVKIWNPKAGNLLSTFLSVGRSDWMTYTRDGYFIGSDETVKKVMMKWTHNGNQYPPDIFPRDNPNPQKVAEALTSGRSKKPKPLTPPRTPAGLAGKRQTLLPGGSKI